MATRRRRKKNQNYQRSGFLFMFMLLVILGSIIYVYRERFVILFDTGVSQKNKTASVKKESKDKKAFEIMDIIEGITGNKSSNKKNDSSNEKNIEKTETVSKNTSRDNTQTVSIPQTSRTAAAQTPQTSRTAAAQTPQTSRTAAAQTPQTNRTTAAQTPQKNRTTAAQTPQTNRTTTAQAPQTNRTTAAQAPQTNRTTAVQTPQTNRTTTSQTPETNRTTAVQTPQTNRTTTAQTPQTNRSAVQPEQTNPANTVQSRNLKIYLSRFDEKNGLVLVPAYRTVNTGNTPLTSTLTALLNGPTAEEAEKNIITNVPEKTSLRSVQVRDGIAYIDLTSNFENNPYGRDSMMLQLKQIVFTATEFSSVNAVQFMINGKIKPYIGGDGIIISKPLRRNDFS